MRTRTRVLLSLLVAVLFLIGSSVIVVATGGVKSFYIPSQSMSPIVHGCSGCSDSDHILVRTFAYSVERGDILVFHTPSTERNTSITEIVARVIAMPGETIEVRDDHIWITPKDSHAAQQLNEPYINTECLASGAPYNNNLQRQTISAHSFFVMGDNRCQSHDSRYYGPIAEDSIVGVAFFRIWPLGRLGTL